MKVNVVKNIYWMSLSIMKKILSLYEYKVGKDSREYQYFKKEVMNFTYSELSRFFKDLMKHGYLEKCDCGASLRKGYSECDHCGGSGYKHK